jgi:hypothetical protein
MKSIYVVILSVFIFITFGYCQDDAQKEITDLKASIQQVLPEGWQIKSAEQRPALINFANGDKLFYGIFILAEKKEYHPKTMSQMGEPRIELNAPIDSENYLTISDYYGAVFLNSKFAISRENLNWPEELNETERQVVYLGASDKYKVFSKGYFWIDEAIQKKLSLTNGDDFLERLILDLGVKDRGSMTANSASGKLVNMKETVVPKLSEALRNYNEGIRYRIVRTLGEIKTPSARKVLIDTYYNGLPDVRAHAGYALTWEPTVEAEEIYIDMVENRDVRHEILYAIRALGEIKSKKGEAIIKNLMKNPGRWREFYTAYEALRKIQGEELPENLLTALAKMKSAKYSTKIDNKELMKISEVLLANKEKIVVDLLDIRFWITKGNINSEALKIINETIKKMGELPYPYIKIALESTDQNDQRLAEELIKEIDAKGF